eukprot:1039426-Pelagomonas_calceolata.AAC.1
MRASWQSAHACTHTSAQSSFPASAMIRAQHQEASKHHPCACAHTHTHTHAHTCTHIHTCTRTHTPYLCIILLFCIRYDQGAVLRGIEACERAAQHLHKVAQHHQVTLASIPADTACMS